MVRQLPDGDWSTSGHVNSCEVSPSVKVVCLPWGKNTTLALVLKKADVFKINGDDESWQYKVFDLDNDDGSWQCLVQFETIHFR